MSSDYRDEVLRDGPVAYWRLGERSGTAAIDETGNGHDGTYEGGPNLGVPGVIVGDIDTAVDFTNGYGRVSPFQDELQEWSIEFWARKLNTDVGPIVEYNSSSDRSTSGTHGVHIWAYPGGDDLYCNFVGLDGSHSITANNVLKVDVWHHIVATYDGATARLYLDGEQVGSLAFSDWLRTNFYVWLAVRPGDTSRKPPEVLDDASVYESTLSAERIQLHYEIALAPDKTADQPFVDLVVLDTDASPVTIISDYDEWTTNELYYGVSNFKLEIDDSAVGADELYKGRFLYERGGSLVFRIEQLDREEAYENGRYRSYVIATGPMVGHLDERITIPPSGSAYDKVSGLAGESAIMHYVRAHCAENAPAARQVPLFGTAVDEGRGASVNKRARYQPVAEVVREIGMVAGLGWRTVYRQGQSPPFTFEVIQGADKSGSVFIEPTMDAVDQQALLDTILGKKTYALVAGQGEGTNRTTEEVWDGTEPTGWNRRELFVDARDLDDTEATEGALTDRGNEKLEETQPGPSFTVEAAAFGEFRYGIDWLLGDILMIRNRNWNVEQPMRVISVSTTRSGASIEISVEFDRAWPSMKSKIREGFTTPGSRV